MGTVIFSSDHDFEMKKNRIIAVFWNFFQDIEKMETQPELKNVKKELKELLEIVSNQVAIHHLQYFIQTSKNEKIKEIFKKTIKELSVPPKVPVQSFDPRFENMIETKIDYYYNTFFSVPFRTLHHSVITITNFLLPLKIKVDLLSFYKFLFSDVNFEKISDGISKEDIFKIEECQLTIKEGLVVLRKIYSNLARLRETISNLINNFQLNINSLTQVEIVEIKNQLISILGSLKLQATQNKPGIDFYGRYELLDRQFKTQARLHDEHYQILVFNFNEVMVNELIISYEIIIESLKAISNPIVEPKSINRFPEREDEKRVESKPKFKQELQEDIYSILKDFFDINERNQLWQLIETGNDLDKPILFLGNGNRLADTFKQFIKADVITGCQQNQLEGWIVKNFQYIRQGKTHSFTPRYLNDIISTKKDLCRKPLLNVTVAKVTGQIQIRRI